MKNILLLFFVASILGSCLKSKENFDTLTASPLVVIPNSNWPAKDLYPSPPADSAFGITTLNLFAGIAFDKPLDKDVTIVFKKDDVASENFNSFWAANYQPYRQPLPSDCYVINSLQLTVPAGSMHASLPITIIPQNFSGADNYIISFSIVSSGDNTFAENFKSIVYTLQGY